MVGLARGASIVGRWRQIWWGGDGLEIRVVVFVVVNVVEVLLLFPAALVLDLLAAGIYVVILAFRLSW